MENLKVTAWKLDGHDRLYVDLPDGTPVGWADRRTGELTLAGPGYRDAVLDALARHTPTARRLSAVPPRPRRALPPLTPENDLSTRRPGAAARAGLPAYGPGPLKRLLGGLPRRRTPAETWRRALAAERRVGSELNRLGRHGWYVLHAVPLPREADIDHLLIGPGGVFCIGTEHHEGGSVRVDNDSLTVDGGPPQPCPTRIRAGAHRVEKVLTRYCGFTVPVQPVLVLTGVTGLTVPPAGLELRVYREREVAALGPLAGALTGARADLVHSVARDRRTWLNA
ncbi:nuclease-related domain-containing protein [Streptomyces sp. CAU 1734]|uniref:nuclease-related domain-containing protein n=1 Tax=Streptomyces sp. CAU 1734 TaxID=3140360 RepID=UPI0032609BBF